MTSSSFINEWNPKFLWCFHYFKSPRWLSYVILRRCILRMLTSLIPNRLRHSCRTTQTLLIWNIIRNKDFIHFSTGATGNQTENFLHGIHLCGMALYVELWKVGGGNAQPHGKGWNCRPNEAEVWNLAYSEVFLLYLHLQERFKKIWEIVVGQLSEFALALSADAPP